MTDQAAPVLLAESAGVLTVTLNRPERLNAMTPAMLRHIVDAFDQADADDDIRVVVVTGSGRAFCAGADLNKGAAEFTHRPSELGRAAGEGSAHRDGGGIIARRIFASTKPVIGAINGPAVGVGASMILPMDIRIASSTARFGFVYGRRGIAPEGCSSWFLPRLVGLPKALDWMLTGRVLPADEAQAAGLVLDVVPAEELAPRVAALATEIAVNSSPLSTSVCRQLVWQLSGADSPEQAHEIESRMISLLSSLPDAREGVAAFLEKRPACFTGRVSQSLPGGFPWAGSR